MLQRKLLVVLGSLIALILIAAVSAIGLLHSVLEDLLHASAAAATGTTTTEALEQAAIAVGIELEAAGRDPMSLSPSIDDRVTRIEEALRGLDGLDDEPEVATSVERLGALVPRLRAGIAALERSPGPAAIESATAAAEPVISEATALGTLVREQSRRELDQLVARFRLFGLIVGIVSIVLLNVSIIVVLRATMMVLRPVDKLVEASRRLGQEEFDHRVDVEQRDEFGELAQAYNTLACQLQSNEQRKVETLHQVARTLNHELNNAISTIELQLTLMDRRSHDVAIAEPLRRIHQSLERMSQIIGALLRVRRIVLTDYLSGVKMLDLEQSVRDDSGQSSPPPAVAEMKP